MNAKLARWGNSVGVRIPRNALAAAGLAEGDEVQIIADESGLRLQRPEPMPEKITLEWIVSEMKRLGPDFEPPTVEWGPDRGSEIIHDEYSAPRRRSRVG